MVRGSTAMPFRSYPPPLYKLQPCLSYNSSGLRVRFQGDYGVVGNVASSRVEGEVERHRPHRSVGGNFSLRWEAGSQLHCMDALPHESERK